ncbi:MAG: hypothetical protein K940chlam2_00996 [Chlamydiae bacterium]|nr:hypothetical protein [Chlamydiota bacterium]
MSFKNNHRFCKWIFCSVFFISSSLFSSESCSCFQLDYTSKKYDHLYSSFRGCIFGDLPKLIEYLGGFELYPSHFGIDRRANHQELMDHYFVDCFTSYSVKGINSLFVELRKDFNAELNWLKKDTLRQIDDLKTGKRPCLWKENGVDQCIPHNYKKLAQIAEAGPIGREAITETENKFYAQIQRDIEFCIGHHQNPFALYDQGAFYFLHGNALQAIQAGIAFIELAHEENEKVDSNVYLQLGEAYSETLAYDKALESLTQAIEADPENKEAYIERAMAYFELGNFDSSLDDYIVSGMRPKPFMSNTTDLFSFAAGISLGALKGGATATGEFIPSILSSLQGIGQELWAFTKDPVQVSVDLALAARDCITFIKEHTPQENLMNLVPELQGLIEGWDEFENEKRGELTGFIVAKYGVEIFAGAGVVKGMKAYRNLKRANNLMTFEAMAISESNRTLIKAEAARKAQTRKEILRGANLEIKASQHNKHILGHKQYLPDRSVITHTDLQKLANTHAGKGLRTTSHTPGSCGYVEIVNFGEVIGYDIDLATKEKTWTTWGKIHYAKDGIHIVPTKPRG